MTVKNNEAKQAKSDRERGKVERALRERKLPFSRPNPHQIKVFDLSFYPSTGAIVRDGHSKETERGADAFIRLVGGYAEIEIDIA